MKRYLAVFICAFALLLAFSQMPSARADESQNLYIEYSKEKAVMLGGGDFTLSIKNADGNVRWSVQNPLICSIKGDNQGVTITPISSGVAIITAECGAEKAYAEINVLDIANLSQIGIAIKEFNKAGTDVEFAFTAGGYESFYNFQGEWHVTDAKGNNVPFTSYGERVVISGEFAKSGDYTVKVISSGFAPISAKLNIVEYDLDGIIKKYLPLITVIVIVILALMIFAKIKITKLGRVQKSLKKIISKVEQLKNKADGNVNKLYVTNKMIEINVHLKNLTNSVQVLNMDNFGYYQTLLDLLTKACNAVDAFIYSPKDKKDYEKNFIRALLNKLLIPAINKAKDLSEIDKLPKKKIMTEIDKINYDAENEKIKNRFRRTFDSIVDVDLDDDNEDE